MIVSYRDRRTRTFATGGVVPAWESFRRQAEKRLTILEAAEIRVNLQWRLCFEWPEGAPGPSLVELVDYH
jgi:proteic killer suppression protein